MAAKTPDEIRSQHEKNALKDKQEDRTLPQRIQGRYDNEYQGCMVSQKAVSQQIGIERPSPQGISDKLFMDAEVVGWRFKRIVPKKLAKEQQGTSTQYRDKGSIVGDSAFQAPCYSGQPDPNISNFLHTYSIVMRDGAMSAVYSRLSAYRRRSCWEIHCSFGFLSCA